MSAENERLAKVKDICRRMAMPAVGTQMKACEKLLSADAEINVAVLGKFKSGKSSFLNSLSGKDVLPIGVVPVTAVITELSWADKENVSVKFLNGSEKKITPTEIPEYVCEDLNPKNQRGAELVKISLPSLTAYKGICLVDTPGLDSALRHNTDISVEWLPNTGLALITVSSDAPLSEQDLELIAVMRKHSPQILVLLTKADRLTPSELEQVLAFVRSKIKDRFPVEIPVFPFSIREGFQNLRDDVSHRILTPFTANTAASRAKILDHKINSLERQCRDYLLAARAAASKATEEREKLKELAREQKARFATLKKDFKTIYAQVAGAVRQEIEQLILAHKSVLEQELGIAVHNKLSGPLNLLDMAHAYDTELEAFFSSKTVTIFEAEKGKLVKISRDSSSSFAAMADDFTARLSLEAEKALDIRLPRSKFALEFEKLPLPDVKVSQAFDSHLELLWFLIPTRLFKKVFLRHFAEKVSFETEKNLTRLAMQLTRNMNAKTEKAMLAALEHAKGIQDTVERALSASPEDLKEIETALKTIAGTQDWPNPQ